MILTIPFGASSEWLIVMLVNHQLRQPNWQERLQSSLILIGQKIRPLFIGVWKYWNSLRMLALEFVVTLLGGIECRECLVKDLEIARANERTAQTGEKSLNWQKLWREEQGRAEALQDKLDTLSGINRAMGGVSEPEVKAFGGFQSLRSRTQQATRESLEKRNKARTEEQ